VSGSPQGVASKCRSCGATVYWIVTKNGKKMPVEADGVSHFARCPQAEAWRR
jgi:hypothetical protein